MSLEWRPPLEAKGRSPEQKGWHGVCIDAADQSRVLFNQSGRQCEFIHAAVAHKNQNVLFRDISPTVYTPAQFNWTFGLSSIVDTCSITNLLG